MRAFCNIHHVAKKTQTDFVSVNRKTSYITGSKSRESAQGSAAPENTQAERAL